MQRITQQRLLEAHERIDQTKTVKRIWANAKRTIPLVRFGLQSSANEIFGQNLPDVGREQLSAELAFDPTIPRNRADLIRLFQENEQLKTKRLRYIKRLHRLQEHHNISGLKEVTITYREISCTFHNCPFENPLTLISQDWVTLLRERDRVIELFKAMHQTSGNPLCSDNNKARTLISPESILGHGFKWAEIWEGFWEIHLYMGIGDRDSPDNGSVDYYFRSD